MKLEACRAEHFDALDLQPAQAFMRAYLTPVFIDKLLSVGSAYTIIGEKPLVCFGFHPWSKDRGVMWAYFDRVAGAHMVAIVRYGLRFMTTLRGEIFAAIQAGFDEGARLVEILGFKYLRWVPEYGPERHPHDIYLQVRA